MKEKQSIKIIDPLDFVSIFKEKASIAFIGNGSGLIESGLKKTLDKWDIIVRFNLFNTKGFEKDVGTNLNIFVTNGLDAEVTLPLEERCSTGNLQAAVVVIPMEQMVQELNVRDKYHLPPLNVPVLVTFATLSNLDYEASQMGLKLHKWTTGTYAIYLLTTLLKPSSILIAGFDLFLKPHTSGHYFDPLSHGKKRALKYHDLDAEVMLWNLLLQKLTCKIFLTEDVFNNIPIRKNNITRVSKLM